MPRSTRTVLSLFCLMMATACSHSEPERPERPDIPGRPGQETVERAIHFSAGNPTEVMLGDKSEDIYLILYRENPAEAPEKTYGIGCNGGGKTVSCDKSIIFAEGAGETKLRLTLNPGYIEPGKSIAVTISVNGEDAQHRLEIKAPPAGDTPGTAQKGTYICPAGMYEVDIEVTHDKDGDWYSLECESLSRRFRIESDGTVRLLPFGGVVDGLSLADQRIEPSYQARSTFDEAEGFFAFNAANPDAGRSEAPHREYLQLEGKGSWSLPEKAIFTDGWLVEHVMTAFGGPWNPLEEPWEVDIRKRENAGGGLQIRILDPYCGASPLAIVNVAPAGTYITILLDGKGNASIAEQAIPFINNDVWDFEFRIAAEDGKESEGKIVFDRPLHNCLYGKKSPATDCTWQTVRPVILDQSSISAM